MELARIINNITWMSTNENKIKKCDSKNKNDAIEVIFTSTVYKNLKICLNKSEKNYGIQ